MVYVPGGTFVMGSNDGHPDEAPAHEVTLSPYFIDRTEVVTARYVRCVEAGHCPALDPVEPDEWNPGAYNLGCDWRAADRQALPVGCITWERATEYCAFVGGRLPTEAEWEFAARGTDGRRYPWGEQEPDGTRVDLRPLPPEPVTIDSPPIWERQEETWLRGIEEHYSWAPGSFANASPFGAVDMAGNVWEWVSDWYAPYDAANASDPSGPASGAERIVRGGVGPMRPPFDWLRATHRERVEDSSAVMPDFGFRCARAVSAL